MTHIADHWVAHTRDGERGLLELERATWLWVRLERAFPDALSCVLMPEHLHLMTPPGMRAPLRRLLTSYTTRFGVRFDLADPEPANSPSIAARMMRYGFFNPYRAGLVGDPWQWRWSTLRDLGSACHPVWTDLSSVAAVLELTPRQALHRLTTSADYDAPEPRKVVPMVASIDGVTVAVGAALRQGASAVQRTAGRRLVVHACYEIGAPDPRRLASDLGCTLRTVQRLRREAAPGLDAVLQCLADPRLR